MYTKEDCQTVLPDSTAAAAVRQILTISTETSGDVYEDRLRTPEETCGVRDYDKSRFGGITSRKERK